MNLLIAEIEHCMIKQFGYDVECPYLRHAGDSYHCYLDKHCVKRTLFRDNTDFLTELSKNCPLPKVLEGENHA